MKIIILSILFILFGLIAFIKPNIVSFENLNKSYTVYDLVRGWGIYSITIGLLLYYPYYTKYILLFCFTISILWHILLITIKRTSHHFQSIIFNLIAIILLIVIFKN